MVTFNADVNARQSDYVGVPQNHLRVTKVFPTLQGEGPFTGRWAVFVRLSGCNLGAKQSCPWCDSDFRFAEGDNVSFDKLINIANTLVDESRQPRLMVLTGGEPLLQKETTRFIARVFSYNEAVVAPQLCWRIQIETNGYFWSPELSTLAACRDIWLTTVVSPKVNARGVYPPLSPDLVQHACLKFLADADPQSPYHKPPHYLKEFLCLEKSVYVSPIAIYHHAPDPNHEVTSIWPPTPLDLERTRQNYSYARDLAMSIPGLRLSLQTHLFSAIE